MQSLSLLYRCFLLAFCMLSLAIPAGAASSAQAEDPGDPFCGFDPRWGSPPLSFAPSIRPEFEACGLSWVFDLSISVPEREYIHRFLDAICEPLTRVMGPPSAPIAVKVVWDPHFRSGGNYFNETNTLVMRRMPDDCTPALCDSSFNFNFLHEVIHSFQDVPMDLGDLALGWPAEGIAVCATELIRRQSAVRFKPLPDWVLESLAREYDASGQMEGEALAGTTWFLKTLSNLHSYQAAGGFWWILTCSQSSAQAGSWADYDYLRSFNQRLYQAGRPMSNPGVFSTIKETAYRPVDGMPAEGWARSQPITTTTARTDRNLLFARFATLNRDLLYQPYHRVSSDSLERLYGLPIRIRVWSFDQPEDPIVDRQFIPVPNCGDYVCEDLSEIVHGAYRIEVDASAYDAGKVDLVTTYFPDQVENEVERSGIDLAFYEPDSQHLAMPIVQWIDAAADSPDAGTVRVWPRNTERLPGSFSFRAPTPVCCVVTTRTVPLPFRRFLRIDLPSSGGTSWRETSQIVNAGRMELRLEGASPLALPTQVHFTLAEGGWARLRLFDVAGREAARLFEDRVDPSRENSITFDPREMPNGVYLLRLDSSAGIHEQKLLVVH